MSKKDDRPKIKIDRDQEERSKDISKFIGEGGLGARSEYYDIEKVSEKDKKEEEDK